MYEKQVERSALAHKEQLEGVRRDPGASSQLVGLCDLTIQSIDAALARKDRLRPADLALSPNVVKGLGLTAAELARTANQHGLGFGSTKPTVIFVGKAHAYEIPEDIENFTVEALGLAIQWLSGGAPGIAAHLAGQPAWAAQTRPFTAFPNDYYRRRARGHTWNTIGRVVQKVFGDKEEWGRRAYLVELSASPRKTGGDPPSPERLAFLGHLLESFGSEGTRAVVFHGAQANRRLVPAASTLGARFLGVSTLGPPTATVAGGAIKKWSQGRRTVFFTHHLSTAILGTYEAALAAMLDTATKP